MKKKQLLHTPEGVRDLYGKEYASKLLLQDKVMNSIQLYGYENIQTPTFEFFDVFSEEIGTTSSRELYKFFDKDGNTLVLRPDFTPSMARCAAKYFMEQNVPIRFCYSGNTFINNNNLQGKLKELTQMGAELIGDDSVYADAEMIMMVIDTLRAAGLTRFQVSIGEVEYFKGICKYAGIDSETEMEIRDFISEKNFFAAEELMIEKGISETDREAILQVREFYQVEETLSKAKELASNEMSRKAIARLEALYALLKEYGVEEYVSFDLGMLSKFHYYTGVIFKAYTYEVGEPIANGGRYDRLIGQFGSDKASIGFGITVDLLHLAIMRQEIEIKRTAKPKLIVSGEDNLNKAIRLAGAMRAQGISAVVSDKAYNNDKFDEIIEINEDILERYGIK